MGRRKSELVPRECVECGKVFMPKTGRQKCCGPECSHARDAKANRERNRRLRRGPTTTAVVTEKTLRTARRRPKGMSKVRWRIELRRRANAEYYDLMGSEVER